jgi:hypothetical protein
MPPHNTAGNYRFLGEQGRPFSGGAVADEGYDMVHAILERPLPLAQGLAAVVRHLQEVGRPVQSIAGFELRIANPLTLEKFNAFNRGYVQALESIGLVADGLFPAARTNVSATISGVSEPSVYAATFTVKGGRGRPAYVMSGVPEEKPSDVDSMLESMMRVLSSRMNELGVEWHDATAIQLYGVDDAQGRLVDQVLTSLGPAAIHGIHWFPSLPPIEGLTFEIDVRSAGTELVLPVS